MLFERPVVLVGLMGSGKSSVGKILAQLLSRDYWDGDEILRRTGSGADRIAHELGAHALHQRESQDFIHAVRADPRRVFGAAASVVLDSAVTAMLREAWVVWLRAPVSVLVQRLRQEPSDRPFLESDLTNLLSKMSAKRDHLYEAAADQIVDENGMAASEVATIIASALPHTN